LADRNIALLDQELEELRQRLGPNREPRVLQGEQKAVTVYDGKSAINLQPNNYLGLATHSKLREAAIEAIRQYGVAVCAGRRGGGNSELHVELDRRIAIYQRTEAAMLMLSNSEANWAVMDALLSPLDVAVVDEASHESVIDGINVARSNCRTYRHLDMVSLKDTLHEVGQGAFRRVLVSTCGVFPRMGEIAPLPDILELAGQYHAISMVDDAHAVGIIGDQGRGTASHFGVEGQCDVQVGGFAKALGVLGGYVACSHKLRELIMQKSNQWRHTQPLPPPVVAACLASLDLLEGAEGEKIIQRAWDNAALFRTGLRELGFTIPDESKTPLVPIVLGNADQAFRLSEGLFREGVYVEFKNRASLRAIITAGHTRDELSCAIAAFERVGKEEGII